MINEYGLTEAIEEHAPTGGPHSAATVASAALGISSLVRYLNHATAPWNATETLRYAATINSVIHRLAGAAYGMDQLLDQLTMATLTQAQDPSLYDDRRDRPGSSTALELAAVLKDVRAAASQLAQSLDTARQLSTHLGNDVPGEED